MKFQIFWWYMPLDWKWRAYAENLEKGGDNE